MTFDRAVPNPVVISQILSHTGGDWVKTRHQAVTSAGFQMKQEEDGLDIGHNTEVYGWIVLSEGGGDFGAGMLYEAIKTPDVVTHNPYEVTFSASFAGAPAVFAQMQTFDGGDPSHLRLEQTGSSSCKVFVEEETCSDAELAHTTETVGILAMEPNVSIPRPCRQTHWPQHCSLQPLTVRDSGATSARACRRRPHDGGRLRRRGRPHQH